MWRFSRWPQLSGAGMGDVAVGGAHGGEEEPGSWEGWQWHRAEWRPLNSIP